MGALTVQILVSLFISILVFMIAFGNVWPSYTFKVLQSEDSPLGYKITQSDGNLIGSVVMLGAVTSISVIGYINEKFGRKRSEILAGLCFVLAWSLIATAKTVTQLVIGRFVTGIGGGMQIVTSLVFIGEISHPSAKGLLIPILCFMYSIGALASYIMGWFCSYDVINYFCLTIIIAFVILCTFLKETPPYLLRNGKEKEALASLMFYRGATTKTQEIMDEWVYLSSQQVESEINDKTGLKATKLDYDAEKLNQEIYSDPVRTIQEQSSWQILRSSKAMQRALVILSAHMSLPIFMDMIGIQTYAGQLFSRATPDISPDLCAVILAVVVAISSAAAIFITDMLPRRVLMISSCLLSATCQALLASMLRWSWAPERGIPVMIVLFCIVFQLGVVNIPFVQISECLLPQMQSFGSTIILCTTFLSSFILLYSFEPIVSIVGLNGIFFLFSFISLLTAIVSYCVMRETRKVPFEIVQDMFENGYLYCKK